MDMKELFDAKALKTLIEYHHDYSASLEVIKRMGDKWAKNKQHIFKLFGNKLKVSVPVEFYYNNYIVEQMIKDFIKDTKELYGIKASLANKYLLNLDYNSILDNKIYNNIIIFDKEFSKETKVTKILSNLLPKSIVDDYITKYSMLLQSFKAKGELVLSIDPIDYLTMSFNHSGWTSCHDFHGLYSTGPFAYLQDSATVIAYVKGNDINIEGITISNKIWRQVVYISNDNKFAIQCRQYPNVNRNNSKTASNLLIKLFEQYWGRTFTRVMFDTSVDDYIFNLYEDVDTYETYWFNDITNKSFKNGFIIIPEDYSGDENDIFNWVEDICYVGHEVECMCGCGEEVINTNYIFNEEYYDSEVNEDEEEW